MNEQIEALTDQEFPALKILSGATEDSELISHVKKMETTVKGIKNFSQTLAGLIRNVLQEVDEQRSDMIKIIEYVSSVEEFASSAEVFPKQNKVADL